MFDPLTILKHAALAAALALGACAHPAAAEPAAAPPGYTMPQTHQWDMIAPSGEVYRIFVSFPDAEPPPRGFPVLYVLDGNAAFASFAETRRMLEWDSHIGKAIVVGVGYPTDWAYDPRRLNDYPPKMVEPPMPLWADLAKHPSGGRDVFADFLTGALRAEIAKRYTVDLNRQSLFGHSLGGLFALHMLYTRPGDFHSIIAASPSMDWNNQGALPEERAFTERLVSGEIARTPRLLVLAGGRDVDDEPHNAAALVRRLDALSLHGLRARYLQYPDETHMTVPVRSVPDTLRFVFEPPG